MRRIGVLTGDFSLYHDLVRALRDGQVPFASLSFGERPDANVGVLITGWRDIVQASFPPGLPVVAVSVRRDGTNDVAGAIAEAERVLEGIREYREVIIGIDPGQRPGVAVLGDGRLLHATQAFRVRDVGALVSGLLEQYPHSGARIRIGHGAPPERDEIVASLWSLRGGGVAIDMVDETGTTPLTGTVDLPPDVAAAIAIAYTRGRELTRPPRARSRGRSPRASRRGS